MTCSQSASSQQVYGGHADVVDILLGVEYINVDLRDNEGWVLLPTKTKLMLCM